MRSVATMVIASLQAVAAIEETVVPARGQRGRRGFDVLIVLPGALCSLSWGGGIGAEAAVGDAAQDRDGRGQGPALVVGEMFDVG